MIPVFVPLLLLIVLIGLVIYVVFGGPTLPPETDEIIDDVLTNELPDVVRGETGVATSDGLEIWYEDIAPRGDSKGTVLFNMGLAGDALLWPPSFIRAFTDAGYRVIRYDYRGTGMSDWVEDWDRTDPYSLTDMAGDAVAVLDACDVQEAHLIGISLGGMVAQEIAINYRDRVSSLTLMSTSGYVGDSTLPEPSSRYFLTLFVQSLPILKYRILGGERNSIKLRLAKMIGMGGRENEDIRETAEIVAYHLRERRGINVKAILQHIAAINAGGSRNEQLRTLGTPTLIIHGTDDRLIPIEHGEKLAELIPNTKTLWLGGVGHVFPYPNMSGITESILSHLVNNEATNGDATN